MRTPLLLLFCVLLAGCYTVRIADPAAKAQPRAYSHQAWAHSLFWGLIPLGRVNSNVCGDGGIRTIKTQIGGLGLIGYALTGGIWTPMHVKITCSAPRTTESK